MRTLILPILLCSCSSAQSVSLEEVFSRVHTSVVTVRTLGREADSGEPARLASVEGLGSGVLISEDGEVLTAAHVVQTADAIIIEFATGEKRNARVVSSDRLQDVALLQCERPAPAGTHVARLGDSDRVPVGRRVFVVGAPLGISHTMTEGHISARRRLTGELRKLADTELFQTDAAINQGNSGGPMFDMAGDVIGIVSQIVSQSGGSDGLGFAVTSNVVQRTLLESPAFWSGIDGALLSDAMARILNVPDGRSGLLVQRVALGSPAAVLGLRDGTHVAKIGDEQLVLGGDIVLEVQGVRVDFESYAKVTEAIKAIEDGGELRVLVLRSGALKTLTMQLERQP